MADSSLDNMYGIKLIWPTHLFPVIPCFDHSSGEDRPALMNFKNDAAGQKLAASLPIGHRCLVYVTGAQLFIWAIELTGDTAAGEAARKRHGVPPKAHHPFTVYRPIRFLARIDPWAKGATRSSVCEASGVDFRPTEGDSHVSLTKDQYDGCSRANADDFREMQQVFGWISAVSSAFQQHRRCKERGVLPTMGCSW